MNTFTRKGYGRIYVYNPDDVQKVSDIIKEVDSFEWDYLPNGFIAPFSEYPSLAYTHKFCDLDIDSLTALCWSRGVIIWCFDNGHDEFVIRPTPRVLDGATRAENYQVLRCGGSGQSAPPLTQAVRR